MTMTNLKKHMSHMLCIVLIAAVALFMTACGDAKPSNNGESLSAESDSAVVEAESVSDEKLSFVFEVTDADGNTKQFNIDTQEQTVGAALLKLGLIAGEDSEYGLYVKTVNGITADYDVDGTYWAFYVNGELSREGVDSTDITNGSTYSFKVEK